MAFANTLVSLFYYNIILLRTKASEKRSDETFPVNFVNDDGIPSCNLDTLSCPYLV